MKKILLSGIVLIVFALYAFRMRLGNEEDSRVVVPNTTPSVNSTPGLTTLPTPGAVSSGSTNPPTPTQAQQGQYKDGTYTGSVADAFYGNVQIQAVISGGKITDVVFLQYPNDRNTSIEINSQAMPILKQEAIAAQSAQVDGASGATQTSRAFIESLGNALQQAM